MPDKAPNAPKGMDPPPASLSTAQVEALVRAQAIVADLVDQVAGLRAQARPAPAERRTPAFARAPAGAGQPFAAGALVPPEPDEMLAAGDLRAAFETVPRAPRRRPRWARDLLE
jgi:hypothetical protein